MVTHLTHRPRSRIGRYILAGALIIGAYVLWGSSSDASPSIAHERRDLRTSGQEHQRRPHLAVVMPFTSFDVEKVQANLRGWTTTPPCAQPPPAPRPDFYLYSNKVLEEGMVTELQSFFDALPSSIKRCFNGELDAAQLAPGLRADEVYFATDFRFTHAEIPTEMDHYNPDARDSDWVAGPNEQFYQLMNGSRTAEGTSHLFMMEPDTRPVVSGWLNHLVKVVEDSEPFWIRGSAFRPACAQRKTSFVNAAEDCHQLGPEIADHINGNALYHIGDPKFVAFLDQVRASAFAKWPFDLAWMRYIRSPEKEGLRRSILKNIVYTDMIQNLGAAPFNLDELKAEHPWTYFVHSDNDGRSVDAAAVEERGATDVDVALLVNNPLRETLLPRLKLIATPGTNNVMLAFGTGNYLAVMRNFVYYVRTSGITNFLLIAMDKETVAYAQAEGVPYFAYIDDEIAKLGGSDSYTSAGFRRVVNRRCQIISTALRGGFHVLQSDLDVIWMKDPFPYFFNGDYEYEIQSDARRGFTERDPAAPFREFVNSGLFYARGTPRMADFYDILIHTVYENPQRREQHLLNTILEANVLRIHYRVLDPILFPNGFQYFSRAISIRAGIEPFCVHNNWVDGKHTKEYRFRELGMWTQDPPEYTSLTKHKFLAYYGPTIDNNGWNNVRASLRSALAIAKILGRTLILPKFYSHHGKDVVVTLDYFLDYDAFSATFPVSFGNVTAASQAIR